MSTTGEEKLDKDEAQQVIEECGQPYEDQVDYRGTILSGGNITRVFMRFNHCETSFSRLRQEFVERTGH